MTRKSRPSPKTRKRGSSSLIFSPEKLPEAWRELARTELAFFCQYTHYGKWIRAPHLELVCSELEAIERGDNDRLILTMPPRHGKSMSVTETFPAWFLGRNPDLKVIEVSYSDSLAREFGDKCRRKIEEFGKELFGISIDHRKSDKSDWGISGHTGGMLSGGILSGITGRGADLMIIDDPVKNRQEADSQTYRDRVWSEWQSTLATRLHPGGRVVVVLTRWHEDDLAGRLIAHDPGRWKVVNLPAAAEDDDLLERSPGEALWPSRYSEKALAEIKITVGSRDWEALYQGRPSPAEGSILKRGWWQFYRQAPARFDKIIQSWDCAFKDGAKNDYVVGQVWGKSGANKYLLDQVRGRMDIVATMQAIKTLSSKWPSAREKLVEDKANGSAVIQMLKSKISGLIPIEPEGGKEVRAQAVSPDIEAGNVFLPENAPWVHDFIEECAAFPNGAHDDQVDAMSQAINRLNRKSGEVQTYAWQ